MSLIPGQNAIIATDPAVGATSFKLGAANAKANKNAGNSTATTAIPITGQGAVCWSVRSRATGSFFVSDILTSTVTEISFDKSLNAKIVKQYPQTPMSGTIDVARGSMGTAE